MSICWTQYESVSFSEIDVDVEIPPGLPMLVPLLAVAGGAAIRAAAIGGLTSTMGFAADCACANEDVAIAHA